MGLIEDAGYAPIDLGRNEDAAGDGDAAPARARSTARSTGCPRPRRWSRRLQAGERDPADAELLVSTKLDRPRPVPGAGAGRRLGLRRPLPPAVRDPPAAGRRGRGAARARRPGRHLRRRRRSVTPTARWPPAGPSSASSSPTTSPPTARRSGTAPTPIGSGTSGRPRANLEGVYAAGPTGSPYLYQKDDPAKLLLGEGGHDVPRNHEGIALVGDQRNDTHLFMSQMQVGFIRTHNLHRRPAARGRGGGGRRSSTRPGARRPGTTSG